MREFICLVAAIVQPRSQEDGRAKIGVLVIKRNSLMYWAEREIPDRQHLGLRRHLTEVSWSIAFLIYRL